MNRMEEYEALLQQLEEMPPEIEGCVARAKARRSRVRMLWRPLASLAAVFCLFVGLVNLSPTVAAACREIPFLEELVDAVMFSPSLTKAVEQEYVQPIGLEETVNDVTVRVEHVIVDQKQVNIFYTIDSDRYEDMTAEAEVYMADRDEAPSARIGFGGNEVTKGEMRHVVVDYVDEDVPSQLRLLVQVKDLADFEFLLTFDPAYTEQGRRVEAGQIINLDGNRFTVTDLEIYPSHIRINIREDAENASWLSSLRFHLELEDGTRIEAVSNGISAFGDPDTPSMTTYLAESSYFYEADSVRMIITGADFRRKDFENVYVNLETGQTGALPQGVEFLKAERANGGWVVHFLAETQHPRGQAFTNFFDAEGNEIESSRFGCTTNYQPEDGEPERDEQMFYLDNFTGTEAWFEPNYTDIWTPEEPVSIEIAAP